MIELPRRKNYTVIRLGPHKARFKGDIVKTKEFIQNKGDETGSKNK